MVGYAHRLVGQLPHVTDAGVDGGYRDVLELYDERDRMDSAADTA
jgi:hypothetical protein